MFEVLITVVVISIGLLGLAGLQFAGLRAANGAQDHTLANLLAQDVEERIRANPVGASSGSYGNVTVDASSPYSTAADCYTSACDPNQLVGFDLHRWYRMVVPASGDKPLLPGLTMTVISDDNTQFQIDIQWGDPDGPQTVTAHFTL